MLSERGVCTNRKRKSGTDDGGDLCLANPDEAQEEPGSSSDSGQGVISKQVASNLAESVVSLTSSFDDEGGSTHPVCTGIVFHRSKSATYAVTSLSLFRSCDGSGKKSYTRTAKVHLPNNQVVDGILIFHNLKRNLGVVSVMRKGAYLLRATCLDNHQQLESHSQVVAIWRCFSSGKLMATPRTLAHDPVGSYCEEEDSACGLLVDFLGNIVGLNCNAEEGTTFIPRSTLLDFVARFQKSHAKKRAKAADLRHRLATRWEFPAEHLDTSSPPHMSCSEGSPGMQKKQSACHYCDPEGLSAPGNRVGKLFPDRIWPDPDDGLSKEAAANEMISRGYPIPVMSDYGMRLLCNFEEEFDEDIWSKLREEVASDMSHSVVTLASFSGDKRFFACTGILIGCNELTTTVLTSASLVRNSEGEAKVADNLKIEVRLPDNEYATGTLQHYNLNYNIAIITIMGSRCYQTAQIYDQLQTEPSGKVVAVGRIYESGKLIATGGTLIDKPSELDCKELKMSTCKITKAGIGGPLIDYDGNFIGMDFYSSEETPYLPRNVVLEVLKSFDAEPEATDLINDHIPNRWPVPKPCWCYPTWHHCVCDDSDEYPLPQPM